MASQRVLVLALLVTTATTQNEFIDKQEEPQVTLNMNEFMDKQEEPQVTLNMNEFMDKQEEPQVTLNMINDDFLDTNPEEVDGMRLHEGDMLLTEDQWKSLSERKFHTKGSSYLWPNGTNGNPEVPYVFTSSITTLSYDAILLGIEHWEDHTCIRFVETNNINQSHLQFIVGSGCYSYIGQIYFWDGQDVSIGSGCESLGIVAHELGHAIGFFHEQSRTDRDNYVYINTENIMDNKEGNFAKATTIDVIEYDLGSLMHYSTKSFTSNGLPTITTIDPNHNNLIGNREGLSFRDIHLANLMYNCIDNWMISCGISESPCLNGGYVGQSCMCECPPGTSGTNCITVIGDYYENTTDNCTETVTTEGTLSSPDNPTNQNLKLQCTKVIQAPECFVPHLNFTKFNLYRATTCENGSCCRYDSLELREDYPNTDISEIYCGNEIQIGDLYTASSSELIIFYYTRSYTAEWSAELTFVQVCTPNINTTTPTTTTPTTTTTTPTTTTTTPTTTTSTTTTTTTTPTTTTTTPTMTTSTTTTTTTTPTTTTTTPTTTTTTPTTTTPPPKCTVVVIKGIFYWLSPNFGVTPSYPTNINCSVKGSSTNSMVTIRFIDFNLHRKGCRDYVLLTHLYDRTKKYCWNKVKQFQSPSFNFKMEFVSDNSLVGPGFNISVAPSHDPQIDCHNTTNLTANQVYTFKSPDFKTKLYKKRLFCEYRLIAPEGSLINVTTLYYKVKKSRCNRNFILMNGAKEKMYPAATSKLFCEKGLFVQDVMTTSTTDLYVAYQKTKKGAKGFKMTVQVI